MASNIQTCDIDKELSNKLKKFRFRKEKNIAALILKVDNNDQVVLEEELEDCSIEELESELSETQPRFVVLSYVRNHDDGRQSFPLCFIYICPRGIKPEMAMMYAGALNFLKKETEMTKVFELREKEDLTEEWLIKKLDFFR